MTGASMMGASKVSRLEVWMRRVPDTAALLELIYVSQAGEERLAEWRGPLAKRATSKARGKATGADLAGVNLGATEELAADVMAQAQAHCDGIDARARYSVVWRDATGSPLTTTTVKCAPQHPGAGEDSSPSGQIAQLQRHLEATQRMHIQSMASVLDGFDRLMSTLSERNRHLEDRLSGFDLERLQADVVKVEGEAVRTQSLAALVETLTEQVLPRVVERYLPSGDGASSPPPVPDDPSPGGPSRPQPKPKPKPRKSAARVKARAEVVAAEEASGG